MNSRSMNDDDIAKWREVVSRYSKAREAREEAESVMADVWDELEVIADDFNMTPYEFSEAVGVELDEE